MEKVSKMEIEQLKLKPLKTNCYLLFDSSDKAIVVDPGGEEETILSKISQLDLEVQYIVGTHAHFDHIGAVPELKKEVNAPFLLHKKGTQMLSHASTSARSYGFSQWEPPTPDELLEEGDEVRASGQLLFKVLHTPGHTPDSISLLWQEETPARLFSGDLVFPARPGRTDFRGGDAKAMKKSLRKVAKLPKETVVHPGHDWAITIEKVREFV